MKLSTFITTRIDKIIDEWESFARKLGPAADTMTTLTLQDHAKGILEAIALDIAPRRMRPSHGKIPEPHVGQRRRP